MRAAWPVAVAVLVLAACGSSGSAPPTPSFFTRPAPAYLLTLDELRTPGFTVVEAAHDVSASALAGDDTRLGGALSAAGVREAATERYFRSVPELATANGPVDVRTTVLHCATGRDAAAAFTALTAHTDAVPGETPESAGALGDVAHADELHSTSNGVALIEVTVTWRTANLVSVLVVRGRYGGTGLGDALILAHAQAAGLR